jgi:hypothetical protein
MTDQRTFRDDIELGVQTLKAHHQLIKWFVKKYRSGSGALLQRAVMAARHEGSHIGYDVDDALALLHDIGPEQTWLVEAIGAEYAESGNSFTER